MSASQKIRLIIAGTRPPKDIRHNATLLEQWHDDHYECIDPMVRATSKQFNFRVDDVVEVVNGMASGWDTLGGIWANLNGIPVAEFPAEWKNEKGELDRAAGVKRNRVMARYAVSEQPEIVGVLVCAWDGTSAGARNMVYEAEKAGCRVWCWADGEGRFKDVW